MSSHRRVAVAAAGIVVLGAVGAALWVSRDGTASDDGTASGASVAAGVSAQPTDDLAVPRPSAPSSMALEPAPGVEVGTDEPADLTGGQVGVVITYVGQADGQVEVDGFVTGVVEDGGTCEVTLTRSGQADVSAQVDATADASTTNCGAVLVSATGLAAGDWTAVLSYSSASSSGTSDPATVAVSR